MKVPSIDLQRSNGPIKEEILASVSELMDSSAFVLGAAVSNFEDDFARYLGVKHVIGVSSGYDALAISLQVLGVGPLDEVVTVPNTFIATAFAISHLHARPRFVDVDPLTNNMDPQKLSDAISKKCKAVLPVHLFGLAAPMEEILEVAKARGLPVVEDAAQAHGAMIKGKKCGSFGDLSCFSFYPTKNLGAFGEGGAIATNSDELARLVRLVRDVGQQEKYLHVELGRNARLHAMQAVVLRTKLQLLDDWNRERNAVADRYRAGLQDMQEIALPTVPEGYTHVYHQFSLQVQEQEQRDELRDHLVQVNIGVGIHYPVPIHKQPCYKDFVDEEYPVAERLAKGTISLPMFPGIQDDEIDYVIEKVRGFFTR